MEHQAIQNPDDMEDEEFPDEFQCFVCLDIMYKPVVLACGHISCFWCVFKAMNAFQESHCPVCRNPYNHFPRICELLHFLLLKLYPESYKRRDRQVAEEEKKCGNKSPQFDGNIIDSPSKVSIKDVSSQVLGDDHSQRTFHEDNSSTVPTTLSSQTTTNEDNFEVGNANKILVTDLQCAVCKQLLCRPIVLNCGHVYCEACIHQHDSVCKCPVCQSAHPKGFPNVCLVLDHFLEEYFREEYSARKASSPHLQRASPSEKKQQAAQSSCVPTNVYSSLFSGSGAKFHPGVGCDYCGMSPIIGLRYRCKDCVEKVGFDLCEGCYDSSSKLPGRFNQQHTKEHQFEVLQPPNLQNTPLTLGVELSEGYDDETDNDDIRIVYLSNEAPDNELELTAPRNTSGDDQQDLENASIPPDSPTNHSGDRVDYSAT